MTIFVVGLEIALIIGTIIVVLLTGSLVALGLIVLTIVSAWSGGTSAALGKSASSRLVAWMLLIRAVVVISLLAVVVAGGWRVIVMVVALRVSGRVTWPIWPALPVRLWARGRRLGLLTCRGWSAWSLLRASVISLNRVCFRFSRVEI